MRRFFAAAAVAAVAMTSAAPASAQAPDEDMPSMGDLIAVACPKWTDDTDGRLQTIPESKLTQRWTGDTPSKARQRKVIVEPAMVLRASPGRYVLLATLHAASDDGVAMLTHTLPAGLAAYTFTTSKTGWKLLKRQEPFDLRGYESEAHLEAVQLSSKVQGVVAEYGSCWQGFCGRWISVYEVGKDGVQPAAIADLPLAGDNVYARPDCVDRLKGRLPRLSPADPARANDPVPPGRCYKIDGRWAIEASDSTPGAFVVNFGGADSGKDSKESSPVSQSLRYQWRGTRYERSSGSNPVPAM